MSRNADLINIGVVPNAIAQIIPNIYPSISFGVKEGSDKFVCVLDLIAGDWRIIAGPRTI